MPSVLLCGVAAVCASACLRVDDGSGYGTGDAEQGTGQSQPSSNAATPDREATLGSEAQPRFTVAGSLAYSFEDSAFLECGFREQWSLRFEGSAFERFQEASLGEECDISGCLFVLSGSGELSARGRYGQVRVFPRELTVTRLTRVERVTRTTDLVALNQISCGL